MQFRYPKSFFKLLAVAFFLVVLPLAVGLLSNTFAVQRLAAQSQQAVYNAARIAHGSRQLSEISPALERVARQNLILKDADLRKGYLQLRDEFRNVVSQMQRLPLDERMRELLSNMLAEEGAIDALLATAQPQDRKLAAHFAALDVAGRAMLSHSGAVIDRETEDLNKRAEEAENSARLQLLVVLPVALLVVAGFTYLLAKPIAQLEAGIRGIGEQRLTQKIIVEGPDDLVQLGERLDWLRQRLQQLEAQKTRFLQHVSHELKTPLTALREGSELLAEGTAGALQPRQQEIVGIVRDNSIHLQQLIEELLRHGEAEFRSSSVQRETVALPALIESVISKQRIALEARQLQVRPIVDTALWVSDPTRLRVIIDNLLSNAVKHSPPATVIDITLQEIDGALHLRVLDAGPGVPVAEHDQIFEPFYRGAHAAAGRVKSTGLGLSICRDHVHALGGTIRVGVGRGDFLVVLPNLGTLIK